MMPKEIRCFSVTARDGTGLILGQATSTSIDVIRQTLRIAVDEYTLRAFDRTLHHGQRLESQPELQIRMWG